MPEPFPPSRPAGLCWLRDRVGSPARRLPPGAELLLLVAVLAEGDATGGGRPGPGGAGDANVNARLRAYTIQRRRVHVRCDNSAKV